MARGLHQLFLHPLASCGRINSFSEVKYTTEAAFKHVHVRQFGFTFHNSCDALNDVHQVWYDWQNSRVSVPIIINRLRILQQRNG